MQSNHATYHLAALTCPDPEDVPNLVVIGVPHLAALARVRDKLRAAGITHYEWTEPDDDLGFTSIATASIDGAQREALKNYRLWKDVRCPAVSVGTPPSKGGSVGASPTGTASSLPEGGRQLTALQCDSGSSSKLHAVNKKLTTVN